MKKKKKEKLEGGTLRIKKVPVPGKKLTCESVEINELIRGEPYAYLTVKVSDAEKLDKETLFECVRKLNHITCGKLHISAILESGYRKYRMDISYSESVLLRNNAWYYATDEAKQSYKKARNQERNERRRQESVRSQTVKMKSFLLVIIAKNISVLSQDVIH